MAVTEHHEQSGLKRYKYTIVLENKTLKIRCQEDCVLCEYTGGKPTLLLPSFWGHVGNRSCVNLRLLSCALLDGLSLRISAYSKDTDQSGGRDSPIPV